MSEKNKLKAAVFVYGEYRTFDIVQKYWNFKDKFDIDYYVSTWDVSDLKCKGDKTPHSFYKKITEDDIKKYLPNSTISIEKKFESDDYTMRYQVYHWKKCLEMCKNSNKKYDIVYMLRTDSIYYFKNLDSFGKSNEKNTIYTYGGIPKINGKYFINDFIFVGNFETIEKFINSLPNDAITSHDQWAITIITNRIKCKNFIDASHAVIRSNMIQLAESELFFKNHQKFWNDYHELSRSWLP